MKVKVLYFAQLRQQAGVSEEIIETTAETADSLYQEIKDRHGFSLPFRQIRVARNEAFCPGDSTIGEGDVLAFMPPMAGG